MANIVALSPAQMGRISPFFPLSHNIPRVDDRRVVSRIFVVIRNGLRWRDAPPGCGPHKTLYHRFIPWSRLGVFDRIFAGLAGQSGPPERLIDSKHLKAHRGQPTQNRALSRCIGRTKGGLNSKLHAACDDQGRVNGGRIPGRRSGARAGHIVRGVHGGASRGGQGGMISPVCGSAAVA